MSATRWIVVGQGLAGTCLAWELWRRNEPFRIVDLETGGSSRVAAGLINPVTGKNFEPSKNIATFLPEAMEFYADVEKTLGGKVWHPHPVLRLADSEAEWTKMLAKSTQAHVAPWISSAPREFEGWMGAIELKGGGRLDTRAFLDGSRELFRKHGVYQKAFLDPSSSDKHHIWCEGAAGLLLGRYGPHRCAKGEILTLRAEGWDENHIRIGAGGWLVPIGNGIFKAGATYDWDSLDEIPTEAGRIRVEQIAIRLGGPEFEIISHDAGVRPILRRSEPLIGPLATGGWVFNALGSKGSLYAPGMARRLCRWLLDGAEPEPELDFRVFSAQRG